ncbi:MAG: hypothetical protein H0U90_12280 [Actinobacteria bacterium]|nr:hypothetical protein [Actinomycetota bacterium]
MGVLGLLAAAVILLGAGMGGVSDDARAEAPVPPSVKRAIVDRFPHVTRFYFPRSLPAGYRYAHWERVELERAAGKPYIGVYTIYFAPPGSTWIEAYRANESWGRWRQLRPLAPCGALYGGRAARLVGGRRTFYLRRRNDQTAAFCVRGYAVELTLNHHPLRPLALSRLVARAVVVGR